jgi:hypothetical protein
MAQYKTDINEYVEEKATKFTDTDEFYTHIDTSKLKVFENGKDDVGVYTKVTLEYAIKNTLRDMKWNDAKNYGAGHKVLKNCYIITYEAEDNDNSIYTIMRYIYEEDDATSAFEMMTKICNMLKI